MECKYLSLVCLCLAATVRGQLLQQEIYDYCDPKLKLCEVFTDHTMCKYPVPGLSAQCIGAVHEPLSAPEKKRILLWHNRFRSNVANGKEKNKSRKLPTSSNMRQIYWDTELEAIATRWAEQCTTAALAYDKCRNTKRFQVSQNVGTRRVNGTTIDTQTLQIVITWYKESKDFDPALVDVFAPVGDNKISVMHFANIIWADTYAIGCARVVFQERLLSDSDSQFSIWTTERLVCNYGPGGNEIGKPVYKRGASCENCPSGTQCSRTFPGLCAIQNADKLEGQQNLEGQEPKDDMKSEGEIKHEIPVTDKAAPEEESEEIIISSMLPVTEETKFEEEKCEGDECLRKSPDSTTPSSSIHQFDETIKNREIKVTDKATPEGPEGIISSSMLPITEKTKYEEEKCEGDECLKRSPSPHPTTVLNPIRRFDEIINKQRPTARKKSRELGDNDSGKRKWIISEVRRNKPRDQRLRNGDTCKCYEELRDEDDEGGSPRMNQNIFLFFFSAFIPFFFTTHCKK